MGDGRKGTNKKNHGIDLRGTEKYVNDGACEAINGFRCSEKSVVFEELKY